MAKSGGPRIDELSTLALLDEDFGLTNDPISAGWVNPAGEGIATRAQLEGWKRAFFRDIETLRRVDANAEATKGALLHNVGTQLRVIRGHSAWKLLDIDGWEDFCRQELLMEPQYARRLVAFAGAVTEEMAPLGLRKCIAGMRLCKRLGLERVSQLVPEPGAEEPGKWAKILGAPVHFKASTAARLEKLAKKPKSLELPAPPSRRTAGRVTERRTVGARVTERHPVLGNLGLRSYARDGTARIAHKPATNREEFLALAALYAALAKEE